MSLPPESYGEAVGKTYDQSGVGWMERLALVSAVSMFRAKVANKYERNKTSNVRHLPAVRLHVMSVGLAAPRCFARKWNTQRW
jgi:hypothetical protein